MLDWMKRYFILPKKLPSQADQLKADELMMDFYDWAFGAHLVITQDDMKRAWNSRHGDLMTISSDVPNHYSMLLMMHYYTLEKWV